MLFEQHPRFSSSADLVLQNTGAIAAAEYGRLVVWVHSPVFSGLGVASTAAGRCISAGAPPRPLTVSVFYLAFACHEYPAFGLRAPFSRKEQRLFVFFAFVFHF